MSRREKLKDNELANALTKKSIDNAVKLWFTEYKTTRLKDEVLKAKKDRIPYLVEFNGFLWLNRLAFSSTKKEKGDGYCTFPFKLGGKKKIGSRAGDWAPRIPVHCVLWRYYNNYKKISGQVSHINANRLIVNRKNLHDEDGAMNRSRSVCHSENWMSKPHPRNPNCIRCPHEPICERSLAHMEPPLEILLNGHPPGAVVLYDDDDILSMEDDEATISYDCCSISTISSSSSSISD